MARITIKHPAQRSRALSISAELCGCGWLGLSCQQSVCHMACLAMPAIAAHGRTCVSVGWRPQSRIVHVLGDV
eukprot:15439227-Alexandrium_andersonii.AAC.1